MVDVDGKPSGNHVPLVVGVTGHRDLLPEELDAIKARVKSFFEQLRASFPDLPLTIMTPLAEGADRLAAEVAYELAIPVIVLLPMPEHLYARDFNGASLEKFQQMREMGECIELPLLPELSEADVMEPGAGRDYQYAQLGAYLAAHSHVLLAIWDGKPSNAPGGTGHVVKFHQHDVIDLIAVGQHRSPIDFTEDESDLVFHIVCSRLESGPPATGLEPGEAYWFTRDEVKPRTLYMPDRYRMVFRRMAEFATDLQMPAGYPKLHPLLPEQNLARCGQGAIDIDRLYHRADYLARHYQLNFYRELRWTATLALLAGASFVAYADLSDLTDLRFMIYPYIACGALVLGLAWLERRFAWQRKYQDYRVLAEGLRVQFYWAVAGVQMENPSRFSHDSFLQRQDLELGWIRNVMRYAGYRSDATDRTTSEALVDVALVHWVEAQHGYYRSKATERKFRHRITNAIELIAISTLLIAALVLAVAQGLADTPTADLLIAMMGMVPFVFAARQHYSFRMAEKEMMAQHRHNMRIFSNAIRLVSRAPDLETKAEILRALGKAALDENGLWILRQRERPAAASQPLQG